MNFLCVGKKGIGLGKRASSPSSAERLAKMAKMAEEVKHHDFRERARDDYNNRRAEGRLGEEGKAIPWAGTDLFRLTKVLLNLHVEL